MRSRSGTRASSSRSSSRSCVAIAWSSRHGRKWPWMEDVTADFVYVRLHGDRDIHSSGYTEASPGEWARKIEAWRGGRQIEQARIASAKSAPPRTAMCSFTSTTTGRFTRPSMRWRSRGSSTLLESSALQAGTDAAMTQPETRSILFLRRIPSAPGSNPMIQRRRMGGRQQ